MDLHEHDALVNELASAIAAELKSKIALLHVHTIGALAIDGHPWHGWALLSVLVDSDEYRKWDIGSWKYQDLSSDWLSPDSSESLFKLEHETFFNVCAKALCSKAVKAALNDFSLADDFEVYIANPDDPNESNYCERYQTVDKKRRKKRRELVGDLDEGLKDPESIVSLKSSNGISSFPDCLKGMKHLRSLSLNFNELSTLVGIECLAGTLEVLHLRGNEQFNQGMNQSVSELVHLEELSLGECGLTAFPDCIKRLKKLRKLLIFGNEFSSIPDWLFELDHLEALGLVESIDEKMKKALAREHKGIEIW